MPAWPDFSAYRFLFVVVFVRFTGHDRTRGGAFPFGFFLALDTQRRPRHSHKTLLVDILAAAQTLAVLAAVHPLQRFLNQLQTLEIAFMKVVEQFLIVADRGEIPFILGVFQRYFLFGKPVPIDGADELLILLSQPLFEFLNFLLVHFGPLFFRTFVIPSQNLGCYLTYNPPLSLKGADAVRKTSGHHGRGIIASNPPVPVEQFTLQSRQWRNEME